MLTWNDNIAPLKDQGQFEKDLEEIIDSVIMTYFKFNHHEDVYRVYWNENRQTIDFLEKYSLDSPDGWTEGIILKKCQNLINRYHESGVSISIRPGGTGLRFEFEPVKYEE